MENYFVFNLQHESASEAFKDAQKQMKSISETIKSKTASISQVKSDIEKSKREASEAHQIEEVSNFPLFIISFLDNFFFSEACGDVIGLFKRDVSKSKMN